MTETDWIGVVEQDGRQLAWRFCGAAPLATATTAEPATDTTTVSFGGAVDQPVPAKLLGAGLGGDLIQKRPADRLPVAARLALAGLCRGNKDWDGVALLLLPRRSYWVRISAEEAVSFQSFLSPSLAGLLSADAESAALQETAALDQTALADALARPEALAAYLSSAELTQNPAALLGYLLGAELAASKPYWLGQRLALIASGPLQQAYAAGLTHQGLMPEQYDLTQLQQQGMIAQRMNA